MNEQKRITESEYLEALEKVKRYREQILEESSMPKRVPKKGEYIKLLSIPGYKPSLQVGEIYRVKSVRLYRRDNTKFTMKLDNGKNSYSPMIEYNSDFEIVVQPKQ